MTIVIWKMQVFFNFFWIVYIMVAWKLWRFEPQNKWLIAMSCWFPPGTARYLTTCYSLLWFYFQIMVWYRMHPLLTLCTVVLGLLAFNTRGVNSANSTTWTFNGLAHITFRPDYQDDQSIHLKLRFRTRQPNGLLFYHYLKSYDAKKFPLLKSYELFAEIRQGYVRVGSNFNQYSDVVPIGSGEFFKPICPLGWKLRVTSFKMSLQ